MNFFLKFLVTIHCFGDFSFFLHFWNQILSSKPNFPFCCWNALLLVAWQIVLEFSMMTSQKGNIFRVTSSLSGDHTGHRWIPLTKASGAELWCFLWSEQTAEQTLEMALTCEAIALIMTSLLCSNLNCSFACIGCIYIYIYISWRHQMETFSALLAIYAGNSPVPGEFPSQSPMTRTFDVYVDLRLNKRLS